MFNKILIANRGEIACRIMRTAERLGIKTVAVYSDADAKALHVALADEAIAIGPAPASESYLNQQRLIDAIRASGAEAVHPGYGFLSENADFAEAVADADAVFIGPPPDAIRAMGLKDAAKRIMIEAGVPVVPGYLGDDQDPGHLKSEADAIGYPVLIKAVAGGGGKGMRRVDTGDEFDQALAGAKREASASFGDDRVLIEKYVTQPRHIEIQVFADSQSNAVHLFERDCSLQRRHQKVIEEAPAPGMTEAVRTAMGDAARRAALAIGYQGAGTVEFIADGKDGLTTDGYFFMEMNTRLQVEHPVTEMITGQDLVEWQLRVAAGGALPVTQDQLAINGHAVEARLYAEDPADNFMPAAGRLHHLAWPHDEPLPGIDPSLRIDHALRIDTGIRAGDTVPPHYDPMIAKVIAHGKDRSEALDRLTAGLAETYIAGTVTNLRFLARLTNHPDFRAGHIDTGLIDRDLDDLIAPDPLPNDALIIAALHTAGILDGASALDDRDGLDPWKQLRGWRLWTGGAFMVRLSHQGDAFEVPVTALGRGRFRIKLAAGDLIVSDIAQEDERISVDLDGRAVSAALAITDDRVTVFLDGLSPAFVLTDRVSAEAAGDDTDANLRAPLPGRITAVEIAEGDRVDAGQALVVLEAMKMEHTLTAGYAGTVRNLTVAAGDQITEGQVLLVLEEAAP